MTRVGLFALNGMGNPVLEAIRPAWLVTRREPGPYPYFPCEPIEAVARRLSVPFWYSDQLDKPPDDVDLILVATYHKYIQPAGIPTINIHPSLNWMGRNPMKMGAEYGAIEGVTAHIMTSKFDDGPVVARMPTGVFDNECELRKALSLTMANVAKAIVNEWPRVSLTRNTLRLNPYG